MKNFLKTFRTVANHVGSFNLLAIVFLIIGTFIAQTGFGQGEPADPCKETEFPFTGVPQTTPCDELGGITYDLFIGIGTPITHSSQISPLPSKQIRIVGDFTIDNNFLLDFAVVTTPGCPS
ncbi:MAG: hypothetical protein SH848_22295 [Saprospiraceae bacterium]|nr:hypothetical protein [Saprospiraceae bacterium]